MKTYILFIFAAHKNQDKFVKMISEEIAGTSDSTEVRYYYGPESAIITFKSLATFEHIKSYLELVLGTSNITFFMMPYIPDNTSFFLEKDIEKHLFGTDKMTENEDKTRYEQIQAQKLFIDDIAEISTNFIDELMECDEDEDDDDDLIDSLKNKVSDPSLDDILDKISSKGMSALTKKEVSLLKNYSK